MSKHTPGPWKQGGKHGHNAGTIYAPGKEDAIASVYGIPMHTQVEDVPERYAEGMANARLVAASPELLVALKLIVADLPSNRDWLDPAVEQMARAAISKAEGK